MVRGASLPTPSVRRLLWRVATGLRATMASSRPLPARGKRERSLGRIGRCAAHLSARPVALDGSTEPTPWTVQLLAQIEAAGDSARGRRFDLNGENRGHRLPQPGDVVPLQVDEQLRCLPSELRRVRDAVAAAVARGDELTAAVLRDLLHTVEPKPDLNAEDCAPTSPKDRQKFFQREGFLCVPRVFEGDRLRALQAAFHRVQAPVWRVWEQEARHHAGNFAGEDFIVEERFRGFGHGRLYFDLPSDAFWSEEVFVDIIAPPKLEKVIREIGGEGTRFGGAQPRTVPGPEEDGGYCSWHR